MRERTKSAQREKSAKGSRSAQSASSAKGWAAASGRVTVGKRAGGRGPLITETTCVRQGANVASRTIDGQEVVIVSSSRKLQILNEVATRIWSLCDGRPIKEIVRTIVDEYDVDPRRATKDVTRFIAEIYRKGMVELR